MLAEGKQHARQVIEEASRIRSMVGSAGSLGAGRTPVPLSLLKSYDQLLELAKSLLDERDHYESRLHRSPFVDPGSSVHQ